MPAGPRIRQRAARACAGIPVTVTKATFPEAAGTSFPELFRWLAARGSTPAGPPFILYHVTDMNTAGS
jgi:hypothetical protein